MDRKNTILTCRITRRGRRAGFSFTEVLFAVMLLGIGFIMVAALFPAAISQTQSAVNEAEGSSVCTDGINFLKGLGATYNGPGGSQTATAITYSGSWQFPATPNNGLQFVAINTPTWGRANVANSQQPPAGSPFINSADPRFGWIPFYRRNANDPFAQVIVVAVQNQNQTVTDPGFPFTSGQFSMGNLSVAPPIPSNLPVVPGARVTPIVDANFPGEVIPTLKATLIFNYQGDGTSMASIVASGSSNVPWAAPGAFLIVADDPNGAVLNGRVFRLGQQLATSTGANSDFQLVPGFDLNNAGEARTSASQPFVFVIGRPAMPPQTGFNSTNNYQGCFTGLAQDIAYQTAVIRVK
jgi:hypothetical protein